MYTYRYVCIPTNTNIYIHIHQYTCIYCFSYLDVLKPILLLYAHIHTYTYIYIRESQYVWGDTQSGIYDLLLPASYSSNSRTPVQHPKSAYHAALTPKVSNRCSMSFLQAQASICMYTYVYFCIYMYTQVYVCICMYMYVY